MFGGFLFTVVVLAVLASVLGDSGPDRPGDPQVSAQIGSEADCGQLTEGIDRNVADAARRSSDDPLDAVVTSYASAYAGRMAELQCPRR